MQFMKKLLDRIVFSNSTNSIDPEKRERQVVEFDRAGAESHFEIWGHRFDQKEKTGGIDRNDGWIVLKFPGTGGRAERATAHPAEIFAAGAVHSVWSVNPPGYGTSGGSPRLEDFPAIIEAAVGRMQTIAPNSRLMVMGNSLGCAWALFAAARLEVQALLLRNPFSLQELIRRRWRYNWWNLGMARYLVRLIPDELDAIDNAGKVKIPVFVIQSECDTMIPLRFQDSVITALGGPRDLYVIPGAEHDDPVPDERREEYRTAIENFFNRVAGINWSATGR